MTAETETISLKELLEAGRITIEEEDHEAHEYIKEEIERAGHNYRVSPVDVSLKVGGNPRLIFSTPFLRQFIIDDPYALKLDSQALDPLSFYMGGKRYTLVTRYGLRDISRVTLEFTGNRG